MPRRRPSPRQKSRRCPYNTVDPASAPKRTQTKRTPRRTPRDNLCSPAGQPPLPALHDSTRFLPLVPDWRPALPLLSSQGISGIWLTRSAPNVRAPRIAGITTFLCAIVRSYRSPGFAGNCRLECRPPHLHLVAHHSCTLGALSSPALPRGLDRTRSRASSGRHTITVCRKSRITGL
jgi:hypothetical protein